MSDGAHGGVAVTNAAPFDWSAGPFDPVREVVTGPAEPLLPGTRPIRDHSVSPDGQWIAFTQAGAQEDLFVPRADGREYRRLTNDSFREGGSRESEVRVVSLRVDLEERHEHHVASRNHSVECLPRFRDR